MLRVRALSSFLEEIKKVKYIRGEFHFGPISLRPYSSSGAKERSCELCLGRSGFFCARHYSLPRPLLGYLAAAVSDLFLGEEEKNTITYNAVLSPLAN